MQIRNTVTLIGNVGARPQLTTLKNGSAMARFSVATNEQWRDKEGKKQTRTEWHTIVSFGKQAEVIGDLIDKGQQIAVVGTLRYNKWVDKHDQNRTSVSIALREFTLLGNRTPRDGEQQAANRSGRYARRDEQVPVAAEPAPRQGGERLPF